MSLSKFAILSLLLLVSACKAGSEKSYNVSQSFNGFDCGTANGSLDQSTETTNEAAPVEVPVEETATDTGTADDTVSQTPANGGIQPVVPGLGIGVITSTMPLAKALVIQDANRGLIVAHFKDGTVAIEHCTNIGNLDFSDSHNVEG